MTTATPRLQRGASRLNPNIPRWLGWAFFIFMAQLILTFLAVLVGGKAGFGAIWLLWPGLPQVVFTLGIIPSHLTDEMQARMLWRLFACMFIYTITITASIRLLMQPAARNAATPPTSQSPDP
ncbi:MAG: hypothetical protein ACTS3F_06485 [Phycisphaerales bacterium]